MPWGFFSSKVADGPLTSKLQKIREGDEILVDVAEDTLSFTKTGERPVKVPEERIAAFELEDAAAEGDSELQ